MKNLSERLVELRKSRNLTQKQLAEIINYSDKVISKWERGDSVPDVSALGNIAAFYSLSLDELINSSEIPKYSRGFNLKHVGWMMQILLSTAPLIFALLHFLPLNFSFGSRYTHDKTIVILSFVLFALSGLVLTNAILPMLKIRKMWLIYTIFGIILAVILFFIVTLIVRNDGPLNVVHYWTFKYALGSIVSAIIATGFVCIINRRSLLVKKGQAPKETP